MDVHVNRHVLLAVALLVVVADAVGGKPGTTQLDWQFAAWALQVIMQFVTVEVWASRILPSAAAPWFATALIIAAAENIVKPRMPPPPLPIAAGIIAR